MRFVAKEDFIYDGKRRTKGEVFALDSESDIKILTVIGKVEPAKEVNLSTPDKSTLQTRELESHKENTVIEEDEDNKSKYSRRDLRAKK